MPTKCPLSILACLFVLAGLLNAAERRVPNQFESIQAAIDASAAGDRILVSPGIYKERIVLKAQVHLRSVGDDEAGEVGLQRAEATVLMAGVKLGAIGLV